VTDRVQNEQDTHGSAGMLREFVDGGNRMRLDGEGMIRAHYTPSPCYSSSTVLLSSVRHPLDQAPAHCSAVPKVSVCGNVCRGVVVERRALRMRMQHRGDKVHAFTFFDRPGECLTRDGEARHSDQTPEDTVVSRVWRWLTRTNEDRMGCGTEH
jgi:hypothetical protein